MCKARTVSVIRVGGSTWIGMYLTCGGHDENITQVGMTCSAQMCVAKAHDGLILVLIASTIFIHTSLVFAIHIVRNGVCFGTQLDESEGRTGSRECMSHTIGAYDGIDIAKD